MRTPHLLPALVVAVGVDGTTPTLVEAIPSDAGKNLPCGAELADEDEWEGWLGLSLHLMRVTPQLIDFRSRCRAVVGREDDPLVGTVQHGTFEPPVPARRGVAVFAHPGQALEGDELGFGVGFLDETIGAVCGNRVVDIRIVVFSSSDGWWYQFGF